MRSIEGRKFWSNKTTGTFIVPSTPFKSVGGNNWVFYGRLDDQVYYLAEAAHVAIKRHTKIQGEANPYDSEWESYFEKRLDAHMMATYEGRQWLQHLWQEQ